LAFSLQKIVIHEKVRKSEMKLTIQPDSRVVSRSVLDFQQPEDRMSMLLMSSLERAVKGFRP
jgi:hypothetical protein